MNVVVLIVEASIASLNAEVMTATPVAPFAGFVELTVGGVASGGGPAGPLSSFLHPPTMATDTNTTIHIALSILE